MPTQVPSGSALAVKRHAGYRRVKSRGPRMLKYAGGGAVPESVKRYQRGGQVLDRFGQQERFSPVHPRQEESTTMHRMEKRLEFIRREDPTRPLPKTESSRKKPPLPGGVRG